MGSACCVAVKDRTITNNSSSRELSHRNVRYSPSWSFQWENRGRVAEEVTSVNWSGQVSRTDQLEVKSGRTTETAFASELGSPLESFHRLSWQKSPVSETFAENSRPQASDGLKAAGVPLEVKEITVSSPAAVSSYTPPRKLSLSVSSISSASPLSTQSHLVPSISTPSRWSRHSPSHHSLIRQASDSRIPEHSSPSFSISELRGWSNASNKGSVGGSSDRTTFSEIVATSRRERWSFDSEFLGFRHNNSNSSRASEPGSDLRNCGVCSKVLSERSFWGGQKIMGTNEVGVVAVLICGHVYHAECLESMTSEINKYDPGCPVCTFGERQVLKLSEKALKAEMDLRAKNRRSRNRVVNSSDFDGDDSTSATFNSSNNNNNESEGKNKKKFKLVSSSSLKTSSSSSKTPFLRRHFSFGSKNAKKTFLEDRPSRSSKKGFFWSRSSKENAS
ncbi:uncharacterized protein LOC124926538 [Impatiens glandulifera]|uniref:uncharacterized protein LOC124926538 n=1 Tax=Impatiens glandulifera TaxID=253017 RepID=UPI001FB185FB|nr:uncharacterized protein LOC124926538 [Impatiens glandulifera]XP_047322742.1 uncharacterized protein LOC124926538 [Impatiens glandulifera]